MYIIQDNITGQQLAHYDPTNPNCWDWDAQILEPNDGSSSIFIKVQVFSTKQEVEFAIEHLNRVFIENGDEIDFISLEVEPIRGYRIKR